MDTYEILPGIGLGSDGTAVTLNRKKSRTRDGQPTESWEPYSWHITFESALREAFRRELLSSECKTLVDLIEHANQTLARLTIALRPDFQLIDLRGKEKPAGRPALKGQQTTLTTSEPHCVTETA
jgi:hypothetical protein